MWADLAMSSGQQMEASIPREALELSHFRVTPRIHTSCRVLIGAHENDLQSRRVVSMGWADAGQRVQICSCEMSDFWGPNEQHGGYGSHLVLYTCNLQRELVSRILTIREAGNYLRWQQCQLVQVRCSFHNAHISPIMLNTLSRHKLYLSIIPQ